MLGLGLGLNYLSLVGANASWTPAWSQTGSDIPVETWQAVAFGNGKFMAVASTGATQLDRLAFSSDGLAWTLPTTVPATLALKAVAYGEGTWVTMSNSTATNPNGFYSTDDGVTWAAISVASAVAINSIAYGDGVFVAVSGAGGNVRTSADGITWAAVASGISNTWNGLAYGNGRFVAVASTGTGNRVMYSDDDGATWSAAGVTYPEESAWRSVVYGNGRFVAVASSGTTARSMYSTDGLTWTAGDIPVAVAFFAVAFGSGKFVAPGGTTSDASYYSTDGATWLAGGVLPESGTWRAIAGGTDRFVTINQAGTKKSAIATI